VYRWEVAVRETVIVGLVGAGGLGYLLARQLAGFQWPAVAGTLGMLIALTCLVDLVGRRQGVRCADPDVSAHNSDILVMSY
jgi:phosphonate transport system permease protein